VNGISHLCPPNIRKANRLSSLTPATKIPQVIPEGYYYVMGDHRNNSSDSRHWGPVPKKYITGKAQIRWWPHLKRECSSNTTKSRSAMLQSVAEGNHEGRLNDRIADFWLLDALLDFHRRCSGHYATGANAPVGAGDRSASIFRCARS
jgi:hypothetical protein